MSSNLVLGKQSLESLWLWLPREAVFPESWGAGLPPRGPGPPSPSTIQPGPGLRVTKATRA